MHLFMNINPDDTDSSSEESLLAAEQRKCRRATRMREDLTGRVWHDIVYKPLLAYPEEIRSVR